MRAMSLQVNVLTPLGFALVKIKSDKICDASWFIECWFDEAVAIDENFMSLFYTNFSVFPPEK